MAIVEPIYASKVDLSEAYFYCDGEVVRSIFELPCNLRELFLTPELFMLDMGSPPL